MIQSVLYASKLSLRFPRVEAVRWDKSPVDIQTVAEVWDLVNRQKDGIGACPELILERVPDSCAPPHDTCVRVG